MGYRPNESRESSSQSIIEEASIAQRTNSIRLKESALQTSSRVSLYSQGSHFGKITGNISKDGTILSKVKSVDIFDPKTVQQLITKERKSPGDLINLGNALSHFSFFEDYKKTVSFSNYLTLLKSIEYYPVTRGEILYSIGSKVEHMYVIMQGSFFVLIRNLNSAQHEEDDEEEGKESGNNSDEETSRRDRDSPLLKVVELNQAKKLLDEQAQLQSTMEKALYNQEHGEQTTGTNEHLDWFELSESLPDLILLNIVKKNDTFGDLDIIYEHRKRTQNIIAREDGCLVKIPAAAFGLLPLTKKKQQISNSLDFLATYDFFSETLWNRYLPNLLPCFEIESTYLNQVIYSEGDPSNFLYFVFEGEFEITRIIQDYKQEYKQAMEFANIPLYSNKSNIKTQIKTAGDLSKRMRQCIFGPRTYFGDDELLHLENRSSLARCISKEGVLYKLSLKNLVKIVCNQNNIWQRLKNNLEKKKSWQKKIFNEPKLSTQTSESTANASSTSTSTKQSFKLKLQRPASPPKQPPTLSLSYTKRAQENLTKTMQKKCEEATSNLIELVRIKSNHFSSERASQTKLNPNNNPHHLINSSNTAVNSPGRNSSNVLLPHNHPPDQQKQFSGQLQKQWPQQQQQLPEKQAYLQDFEDEFVAKLSPIKTSRYFNLKQELLNKRFFSPRSKNLIEIQQNILLAKRFSNMPQSFFLTSTNSNNNKNDISSNSATTSINNNNNNKDISTSAYDAPVSPTKKKQQTWSVDQINSHRSTAGPRHIVLTQEAVTTSIIRKEPSELSPLESSNPKKHRSNHFLQELRADNLQEEAITAKKNVWTEILGTNEVVTNRKLFGLILEAIQPDGPDHASPKRKLSPKQSQLRSNRSSTGSFDPTNRTSQEKHNILLPSKPDISDEEEGEDIDDTEYASDNENKHMKSPQEYSKRISRINSNNNNSNMNHHHQNQKALPQQLAQRSPLIARKSDLSRYVLSQYEIGTIVERTLMDINSARDTSHPRVKELQPTTYSLASTPPRTSRETTPTRLSQDHLNPIYGFNQTKRWSVDSNIQSRQLSSQIRSTPSSQTEKIKHTTRDNSPNNREIVPSHRMDNPYDIEPENSPQIKRQKPLHNLPQLSPSMRQTWVQQQQLQQQQKQLLSYKHRQNKTASLNEIDSRQLLNKPNRRDRVRSQVSKPSEIVELSPQIVSLKNAFPSGKFATSTSDLSQSAVSHLISPRKHRFFIVGSEVSKQFHAGPIKRKSPTRETVSNEHF